MELEWVTRKRQLGHARVAHSRRRKKIPYAYEQETNDGQTQRILKLTPGVAVSCLGGGLLQATSGPITIQDITKLSVDVAEFRRRIEILRQGNMG